MTTNPFGRVITAMVTPMRPDGSVDEEGVRAVVEHLLANGHDGIVVNGTTGEASTLTDDESIDVVRLAKEVVGDRAPVTAGVGSNDTAHSIHMAPRARLGERWVRAFALRLPQGVSHTHFVLRDDCAVRVGAHDLPDARNSRCRLLDPYWPAHAVALSRDASASTDCWSSACPFRSRRMVDGRHSAAPRVVGSPYWMRSRSSVRGPHRSLRTRPLPSSSG